MNIAFRTEVISRVYIVAVGGRSMFPNLQGVKPVYRDFRAGDVRHSLADISKAATLLGYQPTHRIGEGLKVAMEWYVNFVTQPRHDD